MVFTNIKFKVNDAGVKQWLEQGSGLARRFANTATDNLSRRLKAMVFHNIIDLPYHGRTGNGHNTPNSASDTQQLNRKKVKDTDGVESEYRVYWRKISKNRVNPDWLEKGTRPHAQPNNPYFGNPTDKFVPKSILKSLISKNIIQGHQGIVNHPRPFARAITTFNSQYDDILKKEFKKFIDRWDNRR